MATSFAMECDYGDAWSVFSLTDQEPEGDALLCPDGGHPAVVRLAWRAGRVGAESGCP